MVCDNSLARRYSDTFIDAVYHATCAVSGGWDGSRRHIVEGFIYTIEVSNIAA